MKGLAHALVFALAAGAVWLFGTAAEVRAEKEKELLKTKAIRAIVTPDGKAVLAAGDNVRLIDYAAKRSTVFRKEYARPVVSPDGKVLGLIDPVTDKADGVDLINLATKKAAGKFTVPSAGHVASALSPEGRLFAYGGAKDLTVVDTKTGKPTASAKDLGGQPWCLAFSPDGKQLACGFDETKVVLFATDGLKAGATATMAGWVQCVAYSADGKWVAASGGDAVKILDAATGKETATLAVTKGKIARAVAFGADDKVLATGCSDGTVVLWDVATKKPLDTFKMPADVFHLSLSADAKVLTVSLEGNVSHVFDVSAATGGK